MLLYGKSEADKVVSK